MERPLLDQACGRLHKLAARQPTPARRHVLEAMEEGLKAADPRLMVRKAVQRQGDVLNIESRRYSLSRYDRVLLIGGGKAALDMALEIQRILGDKLTGGVVNVPDYAKPRRKRGGIVFHPATHPLPGLGGVRGVEEMLELVGSPSRRDLVICVLSGGGSALMPLPVPGVSLEDKARLTELLLKAGARVGETNTVRKHLSTVKGGRLAERLYPATILSLTISDVVGDSVEDIASGPTAPDTSTCEDARRVLRKYRLDEKAPAGIRRVLERGNAGAFRETPKPGSRIFKQVHNIVVGSNRDPCTAAGRALQRKSYRTRVLTTKLQGEAKHVGTSLAGIISNPSRTRPVLTRPFALVAGGETTVTVRGKGMGGRNQELVLSAAIRMQGLGNDAIASMATDGVDGATHAAGAIADEGTIERSLEEKMTAENFLERNDSFKFFQKLGDLIITGPTGTNVGDIVVAISAKDDIPCSHSSFPS